MDSGKLRYILVYGQWSGGSTRLLLRRSTDPVSGTHPRPDVQDAPRGGIPGVFPVGSMEEAQTAVAAGIDGAGARGLEAGACATHAGARHAPAGCGRGGVAGDESGRCRPLPTMPNNTMNVKASQMLYSTSITSSGGTITRAPDVGLGVVGRKLRAADWALAAEARERK